MPLKVKELIKKLESVGFINRGGKGNHRNYKHPRGVNITISGKLGDDAKPYQERDVKKAIERVLNEEKK
ncbi:MAG: type II toxin-antitoxin system HicA family toxin [Desulfobacteraceae bacterium]|nr:type II toxin-antitoxin system HicA family toxin [Desulfobacteraceae bacterium]